MRYVINVLFFYYCVICVSKLRERSDTRYDVYGSYVCTVSAQEYYMHRIIRIEKKKKNAKVRNYNLRDGDKETNREVLNLSMSDCQLAPLRK